jgi:hypothetical protein
VGGSGSSTKGGRILAYFSHSYRAADRDVNSFFWRLFNDEGFFFTVDPQSQFFSIPYLESMMTLSNCFVAVITRRTGAPAGCSSYILFEYGLAVEAQKPSLVLVEQGLSGKFFPRDSERVLTFNRQRLDDQAEEFRSGIKKLAAKVRGYRNPDLRLQQPCGLVIGAGEEAEQVYTPQLIHNLKTEMQKYGRQLETVKLAFDASFEFSLELEKYDFLIVEARDALQAPWLAGYVLGRAIPSIKVCHLASGETRRLDLLPPIIARHKPEHTNETPVTYWSDPAELLQGVMAHVAKFGTERIEFHTKADGLRYFRRAGRREGKLFVSNAAVSNPLAQKLIARLKLESIELFHYQVKDAIPVGERWLAQLEQQIEESEIFVALLTEEYLQSQWCLYEAQVARKRAAEGKLRIYSYLLTGNLLAKLPLLGISQLEARDVTSFDAKEIVADVFRDIDKELKKAPDAVTPAAAADVAAKTPPVPSLALTEEERGRLIDILAARLTPEDPPQRPAWIKGLLVRATLYAQLAGEDFTGSTRTAATALITRTEALGLLPDGRRALFLLVDALRRYELVSHEHAPLLDQVAQRLVRGVLA